MSKVTSALIEYSHGWRWVDSSGWTDEREVENVKKAINGKQFSKAAADPVAIRAITMMLVGLHARLAGRPGRIAGLRNFIKHAKKHEGV